MTELTIIRKKSSGSQPPYMVLLDGHEIGLVERNATAKFQIPSGQHTLKLLFSGDVDVQTIGVVSGGLIGALMGWCMDKAIKKHGKGKNEATFTAKEGGSITVACKNGAFNAVITSVAEG